MRTHINLSIALSQTNIKDSYTVYARRSTIYCGFSCEYAVSLNLLRFSRLPRRDAITLISPGTEQLNQEIFRDVVPNDNFTTVIKDFGRQRINLTSHNDFYYSPYMYSTFSSEK